MTPVLKKSIEKSIEMINFSIDDGSLSRFILGVDRNGQVESVSANCQQKLCFNNFKHGPIDIVWFGDSYLSFKPTDPEYERIIIWEDAMTMVYANQTAYTFPASCINTLPATMVNLIRDVLNAKIARVEKMSQVRDKIIRDVTSILNV